MPKRPDDLTEREWLFVNAFLIDLNATKAARKAGYAHPLVRGSEVKERPHVRRAIDAAIERRAKRMEITADKVLAELAKLGFSNMADYTRVNHDNDLVPNLSNATREQLAAVTEIQVETYMEGKGEYAQEVKRVKFKLADKRAALVDIGKHLGMFRERVEISGPGGGPVPTIAVAMTPKEAAEAYALSLLEPAAALPAPQEPIDVDHDDV